MDTAARALPCRGERGANLSGMVAIVVDHRNAARRSALLEAPIDTAKVGEALGNLLRCDIKLARNSYGCSRVQYIVPARNVQLEWAESAGGSVHLKTRVSASLPWLRVWRLSRFDNFQPVVGLFSHAVGEDASPHARQNSLEQRIVDAGRGSAVKR